MKLLYLPPPTPGSPSRGTTPATPSRHSNIADKYTANFKQETRAAVAPQRDYSKVANSIVREAVPSGMFGGKSKQLYDYLYSLTRGAIVPRRTVRIPKDKLMKGAGIGSEVTLRTNLGKLSSVRLVIERVYAGTHGGNEYEVFLPEEVSLTDSTPSTPSRESTESSSSQFREGVESAETTPSSTSLSQAESDTSDCSKTFSKTNTENDDDDEAFVALLRDLRKAVIETTGKETSVAEAARWQELGQVLITELKIAATRTTISSVPAFLAEHLRRRLWKLDKKQGGGKGMPESIDTKPQVSSDQTKNCQDCGGTGFYYPQGYEGGVAKCKHERMSNDQKPSEQGSLAGKEVN